MDLLKAEIEKKRKLLESKSLVTKEKKFFKREELIQKTDEEYWRRQAEKELEKKNKRHKRGSESDDLSTGGDSMSGDQTTIPSQTPEEVTKMKLKKLITSQSGSTTNAEQGNGNEEERILSRKDVIKRLRERNEPILLFGESEVDAFRRLRKLEIIEPDVSDKGLRNDFQEAMERVDAAYLEEIVKSGSSETCREGDKKKGAHDVKIEEMNTTIEDILRDAQNLGTPRGRKIALLEAHKSDCAVILKYLKFLLELWGKKLNDRSEVEKRSTQGKIATATYAQTQNYLRPLFKQLTKENVAEDILKHLILIIRYMLEREYVKANDAYLQMAIGNAPWPIGVTMVGIHARTGREKIFAQNIAHVLNDETQRKYIQALKRLMTQCQKMFPTDPSRCVEYIKD